MMTRILVYQHVAQTSGKEMVLVSQITLMVVGGPRHLTGFSPDPLAKLHKKLISVRDSNFYLANIRIDLLSYLVLKLISLIPLT